MSHTLPDFNNTQIAYSALTDEELNRAYFFFRSLKNPFVSGLGQRALKISLTLRMPVKALLRKTLYQHFCGGESLSTCLPLVEKLQGKHVFSVLDFGVEGQDNDRKMESVANEIINTILLAKKREPVPFAVFKPTAIGSAAIYRKVSKNATLSQQEEKSWRGIRERYKRIFHAGWENNVPVMVDAEESWTQPAVDELAWSNMKEFNKGRAIVWNTFQLYLRDRLYYLTNLIEEAKKIDIHIGAKLVRGAYHEKEKETARKEKRQSPVFDTKAETDRDYNRSMLLCLENIDRVSFCAATHNEESCKILAEELIRSQPEPDDHRIWFAQLYGMCDHLTFNLASAGFNVSKYIPYGPLEDVIPYLIRRAEENSSVAGHAKREADLILREINRRKKARASS